MANFAIGDIQGCYQELNLLLEEINFDTSDDKLWLCGDLVNRGPDSLKCIEFLYSIKENCYITLGNHDLHLIALAEGVINSSKTDTLDELLNSHDIELYIQWLKQLPLIHNDTITFEGRKKEYVMTHAGIPPQWTLEEAKLHSKEITDSLISSHSCKNFLKNMYGNKPAIETIDSTKEECLRLYTNYFTRMRFCNPLGEIELIHKGKPFDPPEGFKPWFKHKLSIMNDKSIHLLFGHWAALEGITGVENITALDTGCVWGNKLTAINLEDSRVFSCNRVN